MILSGGSREQWQANPQGLSPRDIAMNVALPEVDGRIITRAVSFKAVQQRSRALETDVVAYVPLDDRMQFVAQLAAHWGSPASNPPRSASHCPNFGELPPPAMLALPMALA